MTDTDDILMRIEDFNRAVGGGVRVQRVSGGYTLFREDTGKPVARFRPTGREDQVEVLRWSHRDRWEPIGDLAPRFLYLNEALEYVAEDPPGCFW